MYDTSALVVVRSAASGATSSVTATINSPNVVLTRLSALIDRYPPRPLDFAVNFNCCDIDSGILAAFDKWDGAMHVPQRWNQ
jgi:hypothetical protein